MLEIYCFILTAATITVFNIFILTNLCYS